MGHGSHHVPRAHAPFPSHHGHLAVGPALLQRPALLHPRGLFSAQPPLPAARVPAMVSQKSQKIKLLSSKQGYCATACVWLGTKNMFSVFYLWDINMGKQLSIDITTPKPFCLVLPSNLI